MFYDFKVPRYYLTHFSLKLKCGLTLRYNYNFNAVVNFHLSENADVIFRLYLRDCLALHSYREIGCIGNAGNTNDS